MYPSIFPDATTVVYATLEDLKRSGLTPGCLRMAVDGGKIFKLVKNTHSAALVIGDPVVYDLTSNAVDYEVKRPATATLNHLAGIAVGAIAISGYGWIQIFGKTAAVHVDGTSAITAGDSLKAANGTLLLVKDAATGTTPAFQNYVVAMAATSSSDTTIAGFVRCF